MEDSDKSATTLKDPVCGMNVEPSTAKHSLDHGGKTYYFCCASCREKFRVHPEQYLAPRPKAGLQVSNITPAAAKPPFETTWAKNERSFRSSTGATSSYS